MKTLYIKKIIFYLIVLIILFCFIFSLFSKNPKGTNIKSEYKNPASLKFIYDLTYEKDQEIIRESNIFNSQMDLIKNAKKYLILDIFLYNDDYTKGSTAYPSQVKEMSEALIAKKKEYPDMPIVLITDPINNFYGAYEQENLKNLREAGIDVVITDHDKMRDSNPLYSGIYKLLIKPFGPGSKGYIKNFFDKDGPKVNIRNILKLANFKGNHRKVYISENEAIISSSNPHDPSAFHENVALRFNSSIIKDLIESEKVVCDFSGYEFPDIDYENNYKDKEGEDILIRAISEKSIFNSLDENIKLSQKGDQINIAIFYLADFDIIKNLEKASQRGVEINIIADANRDAFGLKKNGNPNRSALSKLGKLENINVRWYKSHGEQFHTKMAFFNYKTKNDFAAILGSANFTRRNLKNFNLETDIEIKTSLDNPMAREINSYYERIWSNQDGLYTLDFEEYYQEDLFKDILYKIQEFTGLCTW